MSVCSVVSPPVFKKTKRGIVLSEKKKVWMGEFKRLLDEIESEGSGERFAVDLRWVLSAIDELMDSIPDD